MKKFFIFVCCLFLANNITAQQREKGVPQIPIYPQLENNESFSLILVPDPQSYNKFAANQPLFELQTAWIAQNIKKLNIKAALITGDLVEHNNKLISEPLPNPYNGDQTSRQQWNAASQALKRLDNRLPYIIAQGNHDLGYISAEHRWSMMPEYIYPERNNQFYKTLVSTCPNYQGIHTMENCAFEFHDKNWGDLLIITFEFAPRDEVINWAKELTETERFKNHKTIILTHSWLSTKGERITEEQYKLQPRNWAQAIWEKLVYPSKNIVMILCGHTGTPTIFNEDGTVNYITTTSFRTDKASNGREIPQMMFNAQNADGEWDGNGGDCWLRILEFKPDGETISVRTFSPLFALSKHTKHLAWRTDKFDQFEIKIKPIKKK